MRADQFADELQKKSSSTMSTTSRIRPSTSPELKQTEMFNRPESAPLIAKRKRSDGEDYDLETVVVKPENQKKFKKSKKPKSDDDYNLDLDRGLNMAIAKLDNRLLADYVAKRTKRFSPDLSLVELEDRHISGIFSDNPFRLQELMLKRKANYYAEMAFHDTTSWEKPRTLQDMPSFLEHYNPKAGGSMALSSASRNPGSPHTLVITSAGLRAADITR